jgi:lysophospholipase L1-like esterase
MRPSPSRSRICSVVLATSVGLVVASSGTSAFASSNPTRAVTGAATAASNAQHEVATWGASADRTGAALTDQTVRNVVHTSIAGKNLRVSLSNVFGTQAVTFDDVYVGTQSAGAGVKQGSNKRVTFSHNGSVTVPAGAEVLSDPVAGTFPAQRNLAVSVHAVGTPATVTGHNLATQTSYVSTAGDFAAQGSAAAYTSTISNWYWVDALVLDEPAKVDTVATLGDSITDGYKSTPDANHRWPDYLAQRVRDLPQAQQFGVMNEGISGNKVLTDGAGVSALARLDRDVLSQPDVRTVLMLEGINDISGGATADQIIAGLRQVIARAHSDRTCVVGGTLTPFATEGPQREAQRVEVNRFIRTSGEFDAVVDFDKATRDPQNPIGFLPAYDSGDHLHPSDAGYSAMADAIKLKDLGCKR